MRPSSLNSAFTVFLSFSVGFVVIGEAQSADWEDDFDGGLQANWLLPFASVNAIDGGSSGTFDGGVVNDELVFSDSMVPTAGGAVAAFGVVLEPFQDVRMAGIVNPSNSDSMNGSLMLVSRADIGTGAFYAAEVNYLSGELILYRNDSLTAGDGMNLTSAAIPGFAPTDSYYIQFAIVGDSLRARAFDSPGGDLLVAISATDGTYPNPNLTGVLAFLQNPDAPLLAAWDDLSATAIPEPASVVMALSAVAATIALRRRPRAH